MIDLGELLDPSRILRGDYPCVRQVQVELAGAVVNLVRISQQNYIDGLKSQQRIRSLQYPLVAAFGKDDRFLVQTGPMDDFILEHGRARLPGPADIGGVEQFLHIRVRFEELSGDFDFAGVFGLDGRLHLRQLHDRFIAVHIGPDDRNLGTRRFLQQPEDRIRS